MTALFAFAAVFGGVLVLVFLIGGDMDTDVDVDPGLDLDSDGGLDLDAGGAEAALSVLAGLFSVRNIGFFAAFFGIGGLLLRAVGAGTATASVLALGVGLVAAAMNHRLMAYIKNTDSDSTIRDNRIAGSVARVTLPIAAERKGRVSVEVDGHLINLVALPYKSDDTSFEVDDRVVIVAVENGSALVTEVDF